MMRNLGPLFCVFSVVFYIGAAIRYDMQPPSPKYANPDEHGYRHCASWKLADGTPIYSSCDPYTLNRCGQELEFHYSCCSGFQKSDENLGGPEKNPCGKLLPQFENCPDVVEAMGHPNFASHLRKVAELGQKNGKPFTIFAPRTDDSNALGIYGRYSTAIRYSVVKGRYYADDMKSGVELESLFNGKKLSILRNSYGGINVDCSEVSQSDIECGSGVIHFVKQPLVPPQGIGSLDKTSVMSLLRSNPETKAFADDLPRDLQNDLNQVNSGLKYTVTAPTSASWRNLRESFSPEQLQRIAAGHVSAGLMCTSHLYKESQEMKATGGESFEVKCSINANRHETREVIDACGESHEFVAESVDQVAANGVVHVLRDPLATSSALTLKDYLERTECAAHQKIDKFMDVLRQCDLFMNDANKYAVIAPQNSAFDWWKNYAQFRAEYERFQNDPEYRCKVARYHIVRHDGNLANIEKFSGHTDGHRTNNKNDNLYETTYFTSGKTGSVLNWHYSPVNNLDTITLRGASIYRTSRLNVPPETNISDILESRTDLSEINEVTKIADMKTKVFEKNAPKNLYLATTNDGWLDPRSKLLGKDLKSPELARFKADPKLAENFSLLNHIPLYLWGGDIGYFEKNSVHRFMSSSGIELIFWMDDKGVMRIGYDGLDKDEWPRVVEFNLPARDGIVWLLDGYLKCPPKLCPLKVEDKDTYVFYTAACLTSDLPGETDIKKAFSDKPTEIAKRHADKCIVIKQGEVTTVKEVVDSGPVEEDHQH